MKISLLRYSAWISLVLFASASCRSARVSYPGEPVAIAPFEKITYKAKVTWGERELAGLILVKKADDRNLRIAFYNELGMTYFEGTLDRSSGHQNLIVKNIAPSINYKPFIKNFERCLMEAFQYKNSDKQETALFIAGVVRIELNNGFSLEINSNY